MSYQEEFADIAPYNDGEIRKAIERLKGDKNFLDSLGEMMYPKWRYLAKIYRMQLKGELYAALDKVNSVWDFQKYITSDFALDRIIENSMDSFTYAGLDKLDPDGAYMYISNHRDIVLDCALLNYTLVKQGYQYAELAVGDNLLLNQLATDLFKLNGAITVKRTLAMRDKFRESKRLSDYFVRTVIEEKRSIWIAQKSGRAKDGLDITSPSIIKMLQMSQKEHGLALPQLLEKIKIIPVAISYEYDPCDINKGRELLTKSLKGAYTKKKYDDLIQILKGLKRDKGRVHMQIGRPINTEVANHIEVADQIDRQIHLGYRLWGSNYIAYDYLENKKRFVDLYNKSEKKKFISRYKNLPENLMLKVFESYANPVSMQMKAMELGE